MNARNKFEMTFSCLSKKYARSLSEEAIYLFDNKPTMD